MNKPFFFLSLITAFSYPVPLAFAEAPSCVLPEAPPAFLDLVSKPRQVKAILGKPERTKLFNIITRKKDIPNLFSRCRMTPVEITGEDPLTHQPRKVTTMSYAPKNSTAENLRTVILMPPTGGENELDSDYADHLCRNGMRVVLVQHWEGDDIVELDMDMHDRGAMRSTAAVKDVIEFINPKKPEQLGILGTSVGAISSSVILGVDSRVSTGVLIVGGGGLAEVIGSSSEKTLASLRAARMADPSFGFKNEEDYKKALVDHVKIEPLHLVNFAQPKKVLFYLATEDITVPTANQYKLYHAFGDQELVTHDDNHFKTILRTAWKEKTRIKDFFTINLSEPTPGEIANAGKETPSGNELCRNARTKSQAGPAVELAESPAVDERAPGGEPAI